MTSGRHASETGRRKIVWGARALAAVCLAAATTSCGQLQRQGTGSSYLIVNGLDAAPGSDSTKFGGTLPSDVITVVNNVPTVFNDLGRVRMVLAMKDPGEAGAPTKPTTANYITIEQYHVRHLPRQDLLELFHTHARPPQHALAL